MPAFEQAFSDAEIERDLEHLRGFCRDSRWPRGELNMPRALFTEKAFPEDEAVITTTVVTEGLDSLTHEFIWEQRFGPSNQSRSAFRSRAPISAIPVGRAAPATWQSASNTP